MAPDSSGSHSLRATVALTASFLGPRRWRLWLLSCLAITGAFVEAVVLVMIARLAFALASSADDVVVNLGPFGRVEFGFWTLVAVAGALVVFRAALLLAASHLSNSLWAVVLSETRLSLLRGFLGSSWDLQSGERSGRLQELTSSIAGSAGAAVGLLSQSLVALFSLVAFALTAFFVNAYAAIVVVIAGGLMAAMLRPVRARIRAQAARVRQASLAMATDISEVAHGALEVRVFDVEHEVFDRTAVRIRTQAEAERRLRNIQQFGPVLYQSAALLLVVGCVAAVAAADVTRLGAIGGVVLVMIRSLGYAQILQNSYQAFHASAPYLELIHSELERFSTEAIDRSGDPIGHLGPIEFDHVWFRYNPDVDTLQDLSFTVHPGEVIGIIGPSGAGKSTLVQLLLRLRDATEGTIRAGGRDVGGLSVDDWYGRVAFVPQDAWLYAGSVADNIAFFRPDVGRDAIERAARAANLHDEVMAMSGGYDAFVGERGGRLSGGQRQRLCIARALVGDPDVLVLDEPTSALDVHSETLIRKTVAGLSDTTVFVVAHRLSTLDICDRIMVLRDGVLEEFDTPANLAAGEGFYREALELSGLG